jgi:uncharacterized membrane protein
MSEIRTLLAGEAWTSISFDIKGFDFFSRSTYHEAIDPLQDALEANGIETDYVPTGRAAAEFPLSAEEIAEYDVIVLSDIGYNTLAIPPATFDEFERRPNRIRLLEEFVRAGGGLAMVGGYLSFTGVNGKARYKGTAVETALPVTLQGFDDRVERSDGVVPTGRDVDHAVVDGLPTEWPALLGYNRVEADDDARELVRVDEDPLVVVGEHGDGRSAAFTSDCAPHWGSPEFTGWEHYDDFWSNLIGWLAGE